MNLSAPTGTARYRVTVSGSSSIRNGWGEVADVAAEPVDSGLVRITWRTTLAKLGERSVVLVERWTPGHVERISKELFLGERSLTHCAYDPPLRLFDLPPSPGATLESRHACRGENMAGTFTATVVGIESVDGHPEPVLCLRTVATTKHTHDVEDSWIDPATGLPVRAEWEHEAKGFFGHNAAGRVRFERVSSPG